MDRKKPRELKILTGFRFFAALHVVFYHNAFIFESLRGFAPEILFSFVSTGESAVSFFFILSGFILTHVYKDKLQSKDQKLKYFGARVAKLYPLYVLAMILDIYRVVPFFLENNPFKVALGKLGISAVAYLSMLQSWVPRLTPVWNSPGWSLSCEIFFYISFIFLLRPVYITKRKGVLLFGCFLVPIILFYSLKQVNFLSMDPKVFKTLWRSLPALRVFEFIAGICLYGLVEERGRIISFIQRHGSVFFWGSIIGSILMTLLYDNPIDHKIFPHLCLVPFFATIIVSTYHDEVWGKGFFTNKGIHYLGLVSYALYIVHQPFKNYFLALTDRPLLFIGSYLPLLFVFVIFLYEYFEKPLQRKIRRLF